MEYSRFYTYHKYLLLAAIPAVLLGAVYYLWSTWSQLQLVLRRLLPGPDVDCGCEAIFSFRTQPWINGGLILLASFSVYVLVTFVIRFFMNVYKTKKIVSSFELIKHVGFRLHDEFFFVDVIQSTEPIMFTYGVLKPRIIISSGLFADLHDDEIQCIIYHEAGHIKQHDALVKYFIYAFLDIFFFIPYAKQLKESIELIQEFEADQHALKFVDRKQLLSVLTRVIETHGQRNMLVPVPMFAMVDKRVKYLLQYRIIFSYKIALTLLVSVLLAIFLSSIFFVTGVSAAYDVTQADYKESSKNCLQEYVYHSSEAQSTEVVENICHYSNQSILQMNYE